MSNINKKLRKWYIPQLKVKKCSKCHQWKPVTEFSKNATKPDGLDYQCKLCVSKRQKPYYQSYKDSIKEKTVDYYQKKHPKKRCTRCRRLRIKTNFYPDRREKDGLMRRCKSCYDMVTKGDYNDINAQIYARRYYRKNKPKVLLKTQEYRKNYPDRINAHKAVHKALKDGILVKPDSCANLKCSRKGVGRIEAHHESYKKENWLDVIWLCSSCHKLINKRTLRIRRKRKSRAMKNVFQSKKKI